MIDAHVKWRQSRPISFEIEGHAEHSEYGTDIVCASISVLGQTAVAALSDVAEIPDLIYEINDGYIYCELPASFKGERLERAATIIRTLMVGLRGVAEAYPDYVQLHFEEV